MPLLCNEKLLIEKQVCFGPGCSQTRLQCKRHELLVENQNIMLLLSREAVTCPSEKGSRRDFSQYAGNMLDEYSRKSKLVWLSKPRLFVKRTMIWNSKRWILKMQACETQELCKVAPIERPLRLCARRWYLGPFWSPPPYRRFLQGVRSTRCPPQFGGRLPSMPGVFKGSARGYSMSYGVCYWQPPYLHSYHVPEKT